MVQYSLYVCVNFHYDFFYNLIKKNIFLTGPGREMQGAG